MVDMFCVLLPPGSGDELQGMKKGIMELVDLIIITKADGELLPEVRRLKTEWSSALRLMRRRSANWTPKVNIYFFYPIKNFNSV
jgi:LAO/AO transport system kinase